MKTLNSIQFEFNVEFVARFYPRVNWIWLEGFDETLDRMIFSMAIWLISLNKLWHCYDGPHFGSFVFVDRSKSGESRPIFLGSVRSLTCWASKSFKSPRMVIVFSGQHLINDLIRHCLI